MSVGGKDQMESCVVCGTQTKFWGQVGEYQIFVCSTCGLGVTKNPNIQTDSYHRDEVYQQESSQFKNIFQRRVNLIESLNLKTGKVLEVGSSTGLFLSLLKAKGWDVTGVEISTEAAKYAQERGVPTIQDPIEKLNLPQASFDLVIINHTLEHLQNPKNVLGKLNSLLKVGGVLLIDVPNFGSVSSKLWKTSWHALLPEEHIWHFTYTSLSKLLQPSGFKILLRTSPSGIWDYGNPLLEMFQSLIGMKKRFFVNMFTLIPNLIVTKLKSGSGLTILAQKI